MSPQRNSQGSSEAGRVSSHFTTKSRKVFRERFHEASFTPFMGWKDRRRLRSELTAGDFLLDILMEVTSGAQGQKVGFTKFGGPG